MVAVTQLRTIYEYQTVGVDEARQKVDRLAGSLEKQQAATTKAAAADDRAAASTDKAAQSKARLADGLARAYRQVESGMAMTAAANDAYSQSLSGVAQAEQQRQQAMAQTQRASADSAAALQREGEAYREAGKLAVEHPLLVAAGTALAGRALGGLATTAGAALAVASAATNRFANDNASMGAGVLTAARLAAQSLQGASTAATATGAAVTGAATRVSEMTTATRLLTSGLQLVPGAFVPIAAGAAVFLGVALAIGKAFDDLDRLVQLGQRAETMNLGAGFVKAFDALGPKIRASADEMEAALKQAAGFVQDRFNETNALQKRFSELQAGGFTGGAPLRAERELDLAASTEERIRAGLSAMKELEERGQRLASLGIGEALFGGAVVERMRAGNISAEQLAASLAEASRQQVVDEAAVQRALEQSRAIEDTKRRIKEAVDYTFDFSRAAENLNAVWLGVLNTVAAVVEGINSIAAAIRDKVIGAFQALGNLPIWNLINEGFDKLGLMDKDWRKNAAEAAAVTVAPTPAEPAITARQFPYTFGPNLPAQQAAKEAKEAASEAVSAYDQLLLRTEDRIKELDLETASIGKNTDAVIKMKLANELERAAKKADIDVTADMRKDWDALGTRLAASTSRLADTRREYDLMREGQRQMADDFARFADDVIFGAQSMGQAFGALSKTFASAGLKALLTGEGVLSGMADENSGIGAMFGLPAPGEPAKTEEPSRERDQRAEVPLGRARIHGRRELPSGRPAPVRQHEGGAAAAPRRRHVGAGAVAVPADRLAPDGGTVLDLRGTDRGCARCG